MFRITTHFTFFHYKAPSCKCPLKTIATLKINRNILYPTFPTAIFGFIVLPFINRKCFSTYFAKNIFLRMIYFIVSFFSTFNRTTLRRSLPTGIAKFLATNQTIFCNFNFLVSYKLKSFNFFYVITFIRTKIRFIFPALRDIKLLPTSLANFYYSLFIKRKPLTIRIKASSTTKFSSLIFCIKFFMAYLTNHYQYILSVILLNVNIQLIHLNHRARWTYI